MKKVIGWFGETLMTAGVVFMLFVLWQLGFVAVVDTNAQVAVAQRLEAQFTASAAQTSPPGSSDPVGEAFGILRIPGSVGQRGLGRSTKGSGRPPWRKGSGVTPTADSQAKWATSLSPAIELATAIRSSTLTRSAAATPSNRVARVLHRSRWRGAHH